ncbi:DUF4835 family protein [Paucihalobacter ruber]|uniref:DUF4835 family protein n=1 Tax=Paucihalobacter ruber TaxID=2567861 RepID=A0A506PFC1_9FLAO|nr:DUF4835 family protein [Paucihalobacter ruber]TPV32289.1 DUF4835 family protein [Paucihalobacter ruber]
MRNFFILIAVFFSVQLMSQELNCKVVVDAQRTANQNIQIFKALEKQLTEFINNTKWTNKTYKAQEKINCNMVINVQNYDSNFFTATLQVQASRPVYNSAYTTPIYNFNDRDFSFEYLEFQNLVYNPNQFESNLISVITFHIYMILGMDADTFSNNGGDEYFVQAQTIANYSQQSNAKGWSLQDGLQTRFALIDNILSPTFAEVRSTMYSYHIQGLDQMSANPMKAKQVIASLLPELDKMNRRRPNSFLMRVFLDAKADEIAQIFSGGPSVNISEVLETLNRIGPTYTRQWSSIKF